ncbi:MAG TPA: hypothetical protein VKQ73_14725 [Stellaceae bacterium]|nr:hypothetical protein [Stellaceae bacterium]
MRGDGTGREPPTRSLEGALWRRASVTAAPEDDAGRYLDLAGFADGLLDPDDRERVAEWLTRDPVAAGDVAAARAAAGRRGQSPPTPEAIVARAAALVDRSARPSGRVIPFALPPRRQPRLQHVAGWGGLVAALAVASWLGFVLGVDTSLSFVQPGQTREDGFLRELLDPSTGLRELTGGTQT